jgi:hypothetical protein
MSYLPSFAHMFQRKAFYVGKILRMDDEGVARVKATHGDNYPRLGELKKKYDPASLFRINQNIRPAA